MSHEVLGNGRPAWCVVFVSSPSFFFFSSLRLLFLVSFFQMAVFVLLNWLVSSSLIAGGSGCFRTLLGVKQTDAGKFQNCGIGFSAH